MQVAVPYLLHKLHLHFTRLVDEDDERGVSYVSPREHFVRFLEFLFLKTYPYLQASWEVGVCLGGGGEKRIRCGQTLLLTYTILTALFCGS